MNIKKQSLLILSALVGIAAIPAVSFATPPTHGGYMSLFLGASAPQDTTVTTTQFNPVSTKEARTSFDPGINVGGTAGYDFGYVRLEGEMSYKRGDITTVSDSSYGVRYVNTDGHVGVFAALVNGFFDVHNPSPVTPYFGGGMGVGSLSLSNTKGVDANNGTLNYRIFQSDDETVFVYQAGGGVEVAMNNVLSLDLGYRYFGTSRASMRKTWPNSTELSLESHNATVGLRIKF